MDPLSIAASVAGLYSLASQLIETVNKILSAVKSQPLLLQTLAQDLSVLKVVLKDLEPLVTSPNQEPSEDENALSSVFNGCTKTLMNLDDQLSALKTLSERRLYKRVFLQPKFSTAIESISLLRDQLEKYKSTLLIALHLRTYDVSANSTLHQIREVRDGVSELCRRFPSEQERMNPIQQYLDASSVLFQQRSNYNTRNSQTNMSVRIEDDHTEPALCADKSGGTDEIKAYGSFQEWLSEFAPASGSGSENTSQMTASRASDENVLGQGHSASSLEIPPSLQSEAMCTAAKSLTMPSASWVAAGKVRVTVTNLKQEGPSTEFSETVELDPFDYVYKLIQILYDRGHKDVTGFKTGDDMYSPLANHNSGVPVLVTDGVSSYSLSAGLRINQDEPLEQFYDNFIITGESGRKPPELSIRRKLDGILVGGAMVISFDRTLRVPEDGSLYNMPSLFGPFPLVNADKLRHRLPPIMANKGGVIIPMLQREALSLNFRKQNHYYAGLAERYAVRISCGSINTISGRTPCFPSNINNQDHIVPPWISGTTPRLPSNINNQDYIVAPWQTRLDGFLGEKGIVRQFVAMPLGFDYTAEAQLTGTEYAGGIQLEIAPIFKGRGIFYITHSYSPIEAKEQRQTPRELRLRPGDRLFVSGDAVIARAQSFKLSPEQFPILEDEMFFPSASWSSRPTFIHELLLNAGYKTRHQTILTQQSFAFSAVYPLSVQVRQLSHEGSELAILEHSGRYSPFLDVGSFKESVLQRVQHSTGKFIFSVVDIEKTHRQAVPLYKILSDGAVVMFWRKAEEYDWSRSGGPGMAGLPPPTTLPKRPSPTNGSWEMGLAAGGGVLQEIQLDGDPTRWNWRKARVVNIQILNSVAFEAITGIAPPPSPISIQHYIEARLPFYHVIQTQSVNGNTVLKGIKSVGELDALAVVSKDVYLHKDGALIGCVLCGGNLCDSILRPCNHVFCSDCIRSQMQNTVSMCCKACNQVVVDVIKYSGPMEIPLRIINSNDEGPAGSETVPEQPRPSQTSEDHNSKPVSQSRKCPKIDSSFLTAIRELDSGQSELQEAAKAGDIVTIRRLVPISNDWDEDLEEIGGRTALQLAAENGRIEVVDFLINSRVNVNQNPAPVNGRTALQAAAGACHIAVVRRLLAAHADVNAPASAEDGRTALEAASESGNCAIVELLLEYGATQHSQSDVKSALHYAVEHGHEAVIQVLLRNGFNPDAKTESGETPLHIAASRGYCSILQTLHRHGANANIPERWSGRVPIHRAAAGGHIAAVMFLLDLGIHVDVGDGDGSTAIMMAAANGHDDIVKALLQRGARSDGSPREFDGPALYQAAKNGFDKVVRTLLAHGADIDAGPSFEGTPLMIAAKNGHLTVVQYLVESGASLYRIYHFEGTALDGAARNGHEKVVDFLLSHGGYGKAASWREMRTLHHAAWNGSVAIGKKLLEYGFKKNSGALHIAAGRGHKDFTGLLLSRGADPNKQARGCYATPLLSAIRQGQLETAALLLRHGAKLENDGQKEVHSAVLFLDHSDDDPTLQRDSSPGVPRYGRSDLVRLLLQFGAKVPTQSSGGIYTNALEKAAERGHHAVVETLLAALSASQMKSEATYVASKLSPYRKHSQMVKFLQAKYGAEIKAMSPGSSDCRRPTEQQQPWDEWEVSLQALPSSLPDCRRPTEQQQPWNERDYEDNNSSEEEDFCEHPGATLQTLEGHTDLVTAVTFSPDGKRLASASNDGTARLWDVVTSATLQTLKGHTNFVTEVTFSPDGKRLASASDDRTVRLWDVSSGAALRTLEGHKSWIAAISFSPDGRQVVSASDDGTMRLWDVARGVVLHMLVDRTERFMSSVTAATFSPKGKLVASASRDGKVRLWDAATGTALQTLMGHASPVTAVRFSPDGSQLVSASHSGVVWLWDVATGVSLQSDRGHMNSVTAVTFSPDGMQVASASHDKRVRLWKVASSAALQTLDGHTGGVTAISFSPDGRQVVSASDDKTVRLWDMATGIMLQTLKGNKSSVAAVAFSPDGKHVASASKDRTVRLWDVVDTIKMATIQLTNRHLSLLEHFALAKA